ncbi:MAG TPA: alpha/beta hydrolase [Solimonas sp.]|nr:alpha/beta hydrolase [Solimonas sp.]
MSRLLRFFAIVFALLLVAGFALLLWPRPPLPAGPFVPTASEQQELALYRQPESWFVAHLQNPPEVIDGQHLDPKFQYMLEQARPAMKLMPYTVPVLFAFANGRRWMREGIDREWTLYTKITATMRSVEDREVPGRGGPIHVRIYRPQATDDAPLPVLAYGHGGGWVFSSVAAMDRAVRLIANEAKVIVVSVDYRLAPEHPYPAASDDCEDAFLWARANAASFGGDAQRVAVGGDSAGGHAAINIVQRQIKAGRPAPVALLLYYPGAGIPWGDRSYELFGKGYGLDASFIDFILPRVFPGMTKTDVRDDFMDPLRAKSLAGFPPTILTTAGFDILRDSGRAFAQRLRREGAEVAYFNAASLTHSFLQFSGVIADADRAATDTARLFGEIVRGGALPQDIGGKPDE